MFFAVVALVELLFTFFKLFPAMIISIIHGRYFLAVFHLMLHLVVFEGGTVFQSLIPPELRRFIGGLLLLHHGCLQNRTG